MGCSAAKNVTVLEEINVKELKSNNVALDKTNQGTKIPTTNISPVKGQDFREDVLENVNNLQKTTNGLSFEIKFDEENESKEDSIIQKHPPKRILELQESQGSPPTLEKLQEKLDEAEIRRQQILQQRVQSASLQKPLRNQGTGSFDNEFGDSPHHLRVLMENGAHPTNPYDIAYV